MPVRRPKTLRKRKIMKAAMAARIIISTKAVGIYPVLIKRDNSYICPAAIAAISYPKGYAYHTERSIDEPEIINQVFALGDRNAAAILHWDGQEFRVVAVHQLGDP